MVQFITFEGGDGTGKTTQVNAAEDDLRQRSKSCLMTREPGGTALGKLIRKVLLEAGESEIAASTELFLYLADRAQHVKQVIAPALTEGKIVLCDRFTDSTLAYQGYGRGIDLAWLRRLNDTASGGLRGQACEDRFEREELEFHQRVRRGFLEMAHGEPERFRVVDASRSVIETTEQIREILSREIA
jgi:dTMP kinase